MAYENKNAMTYLQEYESIVAAMGWTLDDMAQRPGAEVVQSRATVAPELAERANFLALNYKDEMLAEYRARG